MDLITFNCSSCQQVLKVSADNAGKQAKCPRCGTAMVIPRASTAPAPRPEPSPAQPYEDEEEPRSRRDRPRREDEDFEDRPSRSRRREEDYDEKDDRPRRSRRREDDDDDYDRPSRGRRRGGRYDDEDDYDRPRKGMSQAKKWGFVRLGVLLVAISACLLAAGAGLLAITHLIFFICILAEKLWSGWYVIGRIGNGLIFGANIVAIVGYVFCVFVPNRKGTLPLAITTLALGAVNLALALICRIIPMMRVVMTGGRELMDPGLAFISDSAGGAFAFSLIFTLFFYAELILFPLFIRAVSQVMRSHWAESNALMVVILASVGAGLTIIFYIMGLVASHKPSKAMFVITSLLGFLSTLCFLGQAIYYTLLLFRSRDEIEA
jgi:hypothetical protein